MSLDLFPDAAPDGEEPGGSGLPPEADGPGSPGADDDWDGPGRQGLYVCLPPEQLTLSGFAQNGEADTMTPGGLLATVVEAVTGEDGAGLAGCSEDQLLGIISAARRMESRNAWTAMAAMKEYAARHDGSRAADEFAPVQLGFELHLTPASAAEQMDYAAMVAARLPTAFAALHTGLIDPVHLKIIAEETRFLSDEDAAQADHALAEAAAGMTFGELRYAARKLILRLDPEAARKRKDAAKREAQVRPFREDSGNGGMVARELPSDQVLASWQHIEQRALDLRAAGMPGTLQELRVLAYLDLLQERDSRDLPAPALASPDSEPPGPASGPSLAARVNITVPLTTLQHRSDAPGEAAGYGALDGDDTRDVAAAAGRHPATRWCITAVNPDGTAAAHACLPGRHPPPGTGPGATGPPVLTAPLIPIAQGPCEHARAEIGYHPSRKLTHLIRARNATCTAPGCTRPAARCDLDHTVPWDQGGLTCECDLAPLCRRHHRCKQAEGWQLTQPEPGVLVWGVPSGRSYTTTPTRYSV